MSFHLNKTLEKKTVVTESNQYCQGSVEGWWIDSKWAARNFLG